MHEKERGYNANIINMSVLRTTCGRYIFQFNDVLTGPLHSVNYSEKQRAMNKF